MGLSVHWYTIEQVHEVIRMIPTPKWTSRSLIRIVMATLKSWSIGLSVYRIYNPTNR